MKNIDDDVKYAADALTDWLGALCTKTDELARSVAALLEQDLGKSGNSKVDNAALVRLGEVAREFLTDNPVVVGAGTFIVSESVEAGSPAIEWWYRKYDIGLERLDVDRNPGSHRYYDYEKLPFFSAAAATGEQTLWGPYLDYLGVEEYILSLTIPFSIHDKFMGIAGCDIGIKDLEPLIMPTLRSIPRHAALINSSNRVILGNSGRYLVGERIKPDLPNQQRIALGVPHLGLSLLYAAP